MKKNYLLLLITLSYIQPVIAQSKTADWQVLEEGLSYLQADASIKSEYADSKIYVLKIDPDKLDLVLLSSKELQSYTLTAPEWAANHDLLAVFNAGMFLADHETNRDYMKNYDFTNNPNMTSDNAVVAFNPKDDSLPPFQIIDLGCEDWQTLKNQYHTLIQGIRMIDCNGKNRWSKQPKIWSMVMIAEDKEGNALFIFTRSPYRVHDFINMVLELELDIINGMYLEGGPEASFYINHPALKVEKTGSYETGFFESDDNDVFWKIPNVIGIKKK